MSHQVFGIHAVRAVLDYQPQTVNTVFVNADRKDKKFAEIIAECARLGVDLQYVKKRDLDEKVVKGNHQGVVADCSKVMHWDETWLYELAATAESPLLLLVLDGVQDPHNLGACLRSANAFGVDAVIIPQNRAVGITDTVRKIACGAAEVTPVVSVTNLKRTMKKLQEQSVWFIGLAAEANTNLRELDLSGHIGLVMGAEGDGMRRMTAETCDFLGHIPMQGVVESLNVSVTAGICLYEAARQRVSG